jgi:hypothetical protein
MNAASSGIKMTEEERFNAAFLKILDMQLKSLIGEIAVRSFYRHLLSQYNLDFGDIPKNIEVFAKAFQEYFGPSAKPLQKILLIKMHSQFGRPFREETFTESIVKLKIAVMREGVLQFGP